MKKRSLKFHQLFLWLQKVALLMNQEVRPCLLWRQKILIYFLSVLKIIRIQAGKKTMKHGYLQGKFQNYYGNTLGRKNNLNYFRPLYAGVLLSINYKLFFYHFDSLL